MLENKKAFGTHIEQKVNDAEVGTEAKAIGKHLIVRSRTERRVAGWVVLRVNEGTEIGRRLKIEN